MRCCGGFFLGLWGDVPRKKRMEHQFNGNSRILKWRYVSTIFLAIICGDIPLHRPYIGLIYGRYLQFRILKWPLIIGMIIVIIIALNDDDFRDNWGCLNNEGY
jgi:hypothetical protein